MLCCRCVDWKSTNMAYECQAVPANEGRPASIRTVRIEFCYVSYAPTQGPITEWNLVDCRDLFPR